MVRVNNETNKLKKVIIGEPRSMGSIPLLEEAYDAKSYESIQQGIYPTQEAITTEMNELKKVLEKHGVEVYQPELIENYNQVFARDVAFAIDDKVVLASMIEERKAEQKVYFDIYNREKVELVEVPKGANVEGGDVVLYNDIVFVGVSQKSVFEKYKTARTNEYAFDFLKEVYPNKTFIACNLIKNDEQPDQGVLHLDCCFMPVNNNKLIICKEGFKDEKQLGVIEDIFGRENMLEISMLEASNMNSNVFSISPEVVISEQRFTRINSYMKDSWQMEVEKIPYHGVSKMGGLLRCSTFPLERE